MPQVRVQEDKLLEAGELHAYVVENGHCHPVETSALKLIEWNLAQAGFSMKGSREAAKMFLETTTMFPVCLNYGMLIYFPSESVKNASCVWLAIHMVRDIVEQTPTTSRVLCYGHADIIVPVNVGSLKRRWHNALVFKVKLIQTREPRLIIYGKPRQELQVIREGVRVRYVVKT